MIRPFTLVAVGTLALAFFWLRQGTRAVGPWENIDGIPFPQQNGVVVVTEKLAHADVYLKEPLLAKNLSLEITFVPHALTQLAVGIRENSFWLSYPRIVIYERGTSSDTPITTTVSIPLTDKIKDRDGSVDLMFFATSSNSTASEDEGTADPTLWHLYNLTARTTPAWPTLAQAKDFARSTLTREKPL